MKLALFPSYIEHPQKMRISEQEPDEEIELLLRQHWIVNVPWIFYSILAALLPPIILNMRNIFGLEFLPTLSPSLVFAIVTLWYLLVTAYMIESFLHWYFNIYVITNQHLIDIDFINLLNKSMTEVKLGDVQSAALQMKGIVSSFFNYGDVNVQTAANSQQITFLAVPYPSLVVDRINDLRGSAFRL